MSQIIINAKNFARFSSRMQTLLEETTEGKILLGKLQSQEIFSKILGAENLHELRKNFKKEKITPDYTHKLNQIEVEKFFNKTLSVEEENDFVKKLKLRTNYIVHRIAEISGYDLVEWNFGNIPHQHSPSLLNCISFNYSPSSDLFKNDLKENISFGMEFLNKKLITYEKYAKNFPTKWLYENFESVLIQEVSDYSLQERKKEEISKKFISKKL